MAAMLGGGFGAATDLGLGDALVGQREEETDEQKRRRQLLEQMKEAVNPFGASMSLGLLGGGSQKSMTRGFGRGLSAGGRVVG